MSFRYCVRTDVVVNEEGEAVTVFGVDCIDSNGKRRASVPDICTERLRIQSFLDLINMHDLSPIHLLDVIEDMLP